MSKTIAIIGGGGRESALVDAYGKSGSVDQILVFPGNDLMQWNTKRLVKTYPHLKTTDVLEIVKQCQKEKVFLVDVAQDNAVAAGLVDELIRVGIIAVGPTKEAGRIEWDKAWAREFGKRALLPQPALKICHSQKEAEEFLSLQPDQAWFIKASGLAEGKGVLPANNNQEALEKVKEMERFGQSGKVFLIESWLQGEEFSTFVFCDGENYKIVGSAQDHKRINDYDEGPNTGGMGCSTPPLVLTRDLLKAIQTEILDKVVRRFKEEKIVYKGVLYLGGMAVKTNGQIRPYVIEFNARWGDPEAQVIIPGIENDLFDISLSLHKGDINSLNIKTDGKARVVVAGVSKGYPQDYSSVKGRRIYGLDEAKSVKGVRVYGAGIKVINKLHYASGGRLFYIVGEGRNVIEARQKAYEAMSLVSVEGNNLHYRTDIGWRDVARLRK